MTEDLFNILINSIEKKSELHAHSENENSAEALANAQNEGLIDQPRAITQKGISALEPYKVDNAIIMAAGESKRCRPFSDILPKGLFKVRGQILIEREIEQLLEAGVPEIILVVGYKAEMFEYLVEKYGVTLVKNEEYETKNNVSSIYAVRGLLGNSYICCADNYYAENIFGQYEYESYYTCEFTEEFADEYCIVENERGYIESIKRGGEQKWFTVGANFWSREFSSRFVEILEEEYGKPEVADLLIDDFHIEHFGDLPIRARKMAPDVVLEFDTLEEFSAFDPDFDAWRKETIAQNLYGRYDGVTRYAGVKTDLKKGRLHFNENLWGPSPRALEPFHSATAEDLYLYDSKEIDVLAQEISEKYGFPYESVFLHNSASEIVRSIMTIMVGPEDHVLLPMPHWSYYPGVVDYRFGKQAFYRFDESGDKCRHDIDDLMDKAREYVPKVIMVTTPAMPTGNLISPSDLETVIAGNPRSLVFVDQAYFGFEPDPIDVNYFIGRYDNVVFSRTFSKFFALAGVRLGYGVASERALEALWLDLPLLRLPVIARRAVIECLEDDAYYDSIREEIRDVREWFYGELTQIEGVHPYRSDTNFVFMAVEGVDGADLREKMIEKGYIFRLFEYDGRQYFRINVAPMETMSDFVSKFRETFEMMRAGGEQ